MKPSSELTSAGRWLLGLCLVLGIFLRGVEAERKSLWLDEFHSLHHADSTSLLEVIRKVRPDFHPPGFFWALSFVREVDPHKQRWLSILLSLLTLLPLWAIAREGGLSPPARIAVAGVFLFAPYQLHYGAELRPYSALQLVAVLLAWAAFTTRAHERTRVLAFGVATAVGLHVHYFTIVAVAAVGVVHLLGWREGWVARRALALAALVGALLFVPWFLFGEAWLAESPGNLAQAAPAAETSALAWWQHDLDKSAALVPRLLVPRVASLGGPAAELALFGAWSLFGAIAVGLIWSLARTLRRRAKKPEAAAVAATLAGALALVTTLVLCVVIWKRVRLQYFTVAAWMLPLALGLIVNAISERRASNALAALILVPAAVLGTCHALGASAEDTRSGVARALELGTRRDTIYTAVLWQPEFFPHTTLLREYAPGRPKIEPLAIPRGGDPQGGRSIVVVTRRATPNSGDPTAPLWERIRSGRALTHSETIDAVTSVFVFEPR